MVALLIITLGGAVVWLTIANDKLSRKIAALEVANNSLNTQLGGVSAALATECQARATADENLYRLIHDAQEK